nr:MAG: ORF1 [TTV-like mini virus]
MPLYRRWRYRKARWRPYWARRYRSSFRWRRKRRRPYWVRRKKFSKLKKLIIREWQPKKIHRLTVKGIYPLYMCERRRISNNLIQYLESPAPHYVPGGGGFSIMQFTLSALYDQFKICKAYWTKTNCQYPLIRYNGCTIKLYRADYSDYVVNVQSCYPMRSTDTLYLSTQPSLMMMTHKAIMMPCKKNNKNRKNYKKIRIPPPSQLQTKWYFQKDFCSYPLFVLTASVASFDRYYLGSTAISTTIGITSLNTTTFQLHDWQEPPTSGYHPQDKLYLWGTLKNGSSSQLKLTDLMYLGGTGPYELSTASDVTNSNYDNYFSNSMYWGNIFNPQWLKNEGHIWATNKNLNEIKQAYPKTSLSTTTLNSNFTLREIPNLVECRYNPFQDKGIGNKIYVVSNHSDHTAWKPIDDPELQRNDLPLWLLTWGFSDWMKKLQKISQMDINYMVVIISKYITPYLPYYLFIDESFIEGKSPFRPEGRTASDEKHWYPKFAFQMECINEIACTGPGVVKLPHETSVEAHMEFKFHFKVGGCPPPMEEICDPSKQEKYPVPSNILQNTSLQSPETPIGQYLYTFDERRGTITQKAAKRIKTDYETEKDVFPFTGATSTDLPASHKETPTPSTTSDSEEETTDIQQQLQHQYKQQRKLQLRIIKLLKNMAT